MEWIGQEAAQTQTVETPRAAWIAQLAALFAQRWVWRVVEFALIGLALLATQIVSNVIWNLPNGDVDLYYQYALNFWTQRPLFHHLPVEYPPLAILPFTLTVLPPFIGDHIIFAIWTGLLVYLGYLGIARFANRTRAILYLVYLILGAAATVLSRFDIVPALMTLVALWFAERRRFGYAYALLAAGVLMKLYPGFLIPLVMIEHWRVATARDLLEGRAAPEPAETQRAGGLVAAVLRLARRFARRPATRRVAWGAAFCLGLIALGFGLALIITPSALSGFFYAGDRPLQVESTPATLLWIGTLFGQQAGPNYSFVSLNYVGSLDKLLKPLSAVALLAGCLFVYWRQARGRISVGRAFVATLCVVLVTNKIFSPQYLIWILPLVAYVEGLSLTWLLICLLTTLDFPIIYQMRHPIWTVTFSWQFMPALAARNLLLLWATARAYLGPRRAVAPASTRALFAGVSPSGPDLRAALDPEALDERPVVSVQSES